MSARRHAANFHGAEEAIVRMDKVVNVPARFERFAQAAKVGYLIVDDVSTKDGRYVHDFKEDVWIYKATKGRTGRKISVPSELSTLGVLLGFSTWGEDGYQVEHEGNDSQYLCTNASGSKLFVVHERLGVQYVIYGGRMKVTDWIRN